MLKALRLGVFPSVPIPSWPPGANDAHRRWLARRSRRPRRRPGGRIWEKRWQILVQSQSFGIPEITKSCKNLLFLWSISQKKSINILLTFPNRQTWETQQAHVLSWHFCFLHLYKININHGWAFHLKNLIEAWTLHSPRGPLQISPWRGREDSNLWVSRNE